MKKNIVLTSLTAVAVSFIGITKAHAACNPAVDACAPAKVVDAWDKSLSAGFNLTRGNSQTVLLTLGLAAHREESNGDIIDLSSAFNFGQDNSAKNANGDSTTRNDFRASGRYDHLLDERWYAGVGSSVLTDQIADLNYRVTVDASPGYYLVKNADYAFRVEAGPSYIFEKSKGGDTNNHFAPRLAEKFDWTISCTSKVYEKAEVLFDLADSKNYLVNAEAGVESALSSSLALVVSVRNVLNNEPASGRDKNDLQTTSALKVAL